jgi:predicted amidohydrolase YtcJ
VTADLLLRGGRVLVLDPAGTVAQALAIRGGRILAVGPDTEVERLAGPDTRVVDLAGRTALPGFVDTHCHVEDIGTVEDTVSFTGVRTLAEAVERVREAAARTPAGEWIRGRIWHPVSQLAEARRPTREELDAATVAHPVHLPFGHSSAVNSVALARAGIDRDTADPPGGTIERGPDREPTGILEESAERLVKDILPPWSPAQRARQFERAMRTLNALGITGVVGGATAPSDVAALRALRDAGRATVRFGAVVAPTGELNPSVDLEEWEAWFARHPAPDETDPWVREVGIKLQADGGMSLRTAALREPYPDSDYRGELVVDAGRLAALTGVAARAGWRVAVHAVGDAGIDLVLDAFEAVHRETRIDHRRFVLVHASLMTRDQTARARMLGLHAAVQSGFLWDKAAVIRENLGVERAARAVPIRMLIDEMGMENVSAGTDYPINPLEPLVNLLLMTTRRDARGADVGAAEAVTREEALRLLTSSATRYTFDEHERGTLEPGRLADVVVLSGDPLTVPDAELTGLRTELTVVGGRVVFERAGVPA